ncbi:P-loop containing nucleoside triphosphate hydrolase protein [Cladochytrium replicatum]|nr:P-loop containing nucleoside triphosphate hydrolase protein [Cladochytrium replicatum]
MEKVLFPALFKYIHDTFPAEASALLTDLIRLSDLRAPPDWHPDARTMKREIHLHVGPTNSGKTHNAIQRLKTVKRGIYCGPLRLLAHEIYDRFNREGIPMNLVTGEERRVSDGVHLFSSTVEMAFAGAAFDVAVIDEIQMIADEQRGWAWTQAVLGLPAKELHLCGEETAVDLLRKLCAETGDVLKIYRYERLTPLEVDPRSLDGNLKLVGPKDCVITFSRNNVFAIKREIERKTKYRCAVVYGSLPPEIRAEQAKAFNAKQSPYDILVASDAIGMGLNLNIRRIVFERLEKFDGKNTRDLSYSQIKQIGGRAGRFKTDFETGYVTTLESADVNLLQKAMAARLPALPSAGLLPTLDMIERFAKLLPDDSLAALLDKFEQLARVDGNYFLCNLENQRRVASLLEPLTSLSLRDRFLFCQSPAPLDDGGIGERSLVRMARAVALRQQCLVEDLVQLPNEDFLPQRTDQLQDLETVHKVIVLYLWLRYL